ncbi:hypothetical protein C8R45DRAFT_970130 [Mycena sanguinolenta]|nr:hypothetical protein C8R45DRAFT_970130 [Mycena sanguinolenta]
MFHFSSRNRGMPLRSIVVNLSDHIRGEATTGYRFVAVSVETKVPYAVGQQLCDLRGFRRWIAKGLKMFVHCIVLHTLTNLTRETLANGQCSDPLHQRLHILGKLSRRYVGRLMVYTYHISARSSAGNFDFGDDICRECSGATAEAKIIGLCEEFLKYWVFEHLERCRHYYGGRRHRQPNTLHMLVHESVLGNLRKTLLGDG